MSTSERLFIGGRWVGGTGELLNVISPASEEVVTSMRSASNDDVDAAVRAARDAFDNGPWPRMSLEERIAVVAEFRRLVGDDQDELARVTTEEVGCPITQSRAIQATTPLKVMDEYMAVAREYPFRSVRRASTGSALVTKEPVGVVAAVVPWNVPLGIATQKTVPALLAGCAVIIKPAPQTPLGALHLARLAEKAGFPAGVVNVIPAERDASEHLISHPGVDKVSFTGSTAAGRRIAAICGNDLRRLTLELGGKSAAIFLDDADLDQAVEALRLGSFRNSGQICTLKTRLLVSRRREPELLERLSSLVDSMPVGDPFDESTQIGPMVTSVQRDVVEGYVNTGTAEGAGLVVGGRRPAGIERGWYFEPTVFRGVTPEMTIAREEIFGPVVAVMAYDDEDQAIAVANDSRYGLSGAVFTTDLDRGVAVANRMRTGVVELNGSPIGLRAPFGGMKDSGMGRENGPEGIDPYTESRSVGIPRPYADDLEKRLAKTVATGEVLS